MNLEISPYYSNVCCCCLANKQNFRYSSREYWTFPEDSMTAKDGCLVCEWALWLLSLEVIIVMIAASWWYSRSLIWSAMGLDLVFLLAPQLSCALPPSDMPLQRIRIQLHSASILSATTRKGYLISVKSATLARSTQTLSAMLGLSMKTPMTLLNHFRSAWKSRWNSSALLAQRRTYDYPYVRQSGLAIPGLFPRRY